jgi:hypothetical protein
MGVLSDDRAQDLTAQLQGLSSTANQMVQAVRAALVAVSGEDVPGLASLTTELAELVNLAKRQAAELDVAVRLASVGLGDDVFVSYGLGGGAAP